MYVVNKHLVVLLESRESRAAREENPRKHRRYAISCTCRSRRDENEHCLHTRAFLEDSVAPGKWRYITAKPMSAPDSPASSPNVGRETSDTFPSRRKAAA